MKTPRQILLERHHQANPKLDTIRRKALGALRESAGRDALPPDRTERPSVWTWVNKAWLELIWPSRRAWGGLAAVWLAVLAANLAMKATFQVASGVKSTPAREVVRAFEAQQRLLAELLPPVKQPSGQPQFKGGGPAPTAPDSAKPESGTPPPRGTKQSQMQETPNPRYAGSCEFAAFCHLDFGFVSDFRTILS